MLTRTPHRTMFFAGMLTLAAASGWWAVEILGRYAGLFVLPAPTIPGLFAHAWLMVYALFPCFMAGFLYTAGPRWLGTADVPRSLYLTTFIGMVSGVALWLPGIYLGKAWLLAASAALAIGWLTLWLTVLRMLAAAERKVSHAVVIALALGVGCAGLGIFSLGILRNDGMLEHLAVRTGLWGALLPIFYAVCHRMLPFFAQAVIPGYEIIRPFRYLVAVPLLCYLRLALGILGWLEGLVVVDAALCLITLVSGLRWQPLRTRGSALLWSLFVAYLWLPLGLALQTVRDLGFVLTGDWWLGRAPIHALGMGFMAGLVVAMVTRVTLGHSGRRLVMGRAALAAFLLVEAAALARVLSEMTTLPFAAGLVASLALWLAGTLSWIGVHAPMYLQPRADGKAG